MPEQDVPNGKQGNTPAPRRETRVFPVKIKHPCGFAGNFVPWETRETGFVVGGRVDHKNDQKFPPEYTRAPAPRIAEKSRGPENRGLLVSLVSFVRVSEYPCGFAGGSNGKHPCCRLFPVFPITRESARGNGSSLALSPAGNRDRVEILGCNFLALATLGVTK